MTPLRLRYRQAGAASCLALFLGACIGTVRPGDAPDERGDVNSADVNSADVGDRSPTSGRGPSDARSAPPAVARRLTHAEYVFTVSDLLGVAPHEVGPFPAEEITDGFDNDARALSFPPALAEAALREAEKLAARLVANLAVHLPCSAAGNDACADTFIRDFGKRAWRRPLTDDERVRLRQVFLAGKRSGDFRAAIEMVATTMFVAPPFLYRFEQGTGAGVPGKPGLTRVTSWEMASRLSYLLWQSLPDARLLQAADKGELSTTEAVATEAARMLGDKRAERVFSNFTRQWLAMDAIAIIDKDQQVFPRWNIDLRRLWREELESFVTSVVTAPDSSLRTLLSARHSFANEALAGFYGLTGISGVQFRRVEFVGDTRDGLLTRAGILAMDGFDQSSPVLRGKYVRERFLCQMPPPPPPTVNDTPSRVPPNATTRQQANAHVADPSCRGCHQLMDPIGFGFEAYDAMGVHRTHENGISVDVRGDVVASDIGSFAGIRELQDRMSASRDVRSCVARQWFRFAMGRQASDDESPTVTTMAEALIGPDGFLALARATVRSDAFLHVRRDGVTP